MTKFTFISEEPQDYSKVTFEFNAISLDTMLRQFESFLRGSGYTFDGYLEIVEPLSEELSDVEIDDVNNVGEKVFANLVDGLNGVSAIENELCSVCGISKGRMEGHKCWDEKCPMKEYNAN